MAAFTDEIGQAYSSEFFGYMSGWMFVLTVAFIIIGGILGGLLGNRILKKHFVKAGIA